MKTYFEQVKADVLNYLLDEVEATADAYIVEGREQRDADELIEALDDVLWIDDSVTGNGSGSYYCNSSMARESILANIETVVDACKEWDCLDKFADKIATKDWEWLDVAARCYVLYGAVSEAVEEWAEDHPLS